MARPRKRQVWKRKSDGAEVEVQFRRRTRPMAGVRAHSDMVWSMVAWTRRNTGGIVHETDFVSEYEFVRAGVLGDSHQPDEEEGTTT